MIETTSARRNKGKMRLAVISALSILLILAADRPHRSFLIWNVTASVPVGLYRLAKVVPVRGDIVAVRLPRSIAGFASARGYLPHNVLLLKPLGATFGDQFCRRGSFVLINGALRAIALSTDNRGFRLPMWRGCKTLGPDEVVLIGAHRGSYDSRYFGSVRTSQIQGRVVPIWIKQQ